LLHFNIDTKRCPLPTAFLWHECRVRGFHPTCGDREVTIHTGGNIFGVTGHNGVLGTGNERSSILNIHASGEDPDDVISFTPVPLVGDNLVSWLAAARQHSSWKDCVVENMSWDGTAAENIDKYQREVGVEKLVMKIKMVVVHTQ
jgi:hypothetical protein